MDVSRRVKIDHETTLVIRKPRPHTSQGRGASVGTPSPAALSSPSHSPSQSTALASSSSSSLSSLDKCKVTASSSSSSSSAVASSSSAVASSSSAVASSSSSSSSALASSSSAVASSSALASSSLTPIFTAPSPLSDAARLGHLSVMPRIMNIVVTVDLGCPLELARVVRRVRNSEYNPKTFSGCIVRLSQPRTTALLFTTGKVVVTGAKTETDAHHAACLVAKITQKIGFNSSFRHFQVRNMVCMVDFHFPVNLEKLSSQHFSFCRFEPEIFPAVVYRLLQPKTTILIFVNGKCVFLGNKSRRGIYKAVLSIYPVLERFRKRTSTMSQPE